MLAELVSIPTDGASLDGLYYEPVPPARAAAQLFHGNGANFYGGPSRFLPPHLVGAGIACLAYNRRGHDTLTTRTRSPEGNAFQIYAEAIADDDGAARFLSERGHHSPVAIGHSNGGLLAARHAADHPEVPALVLLSAHCGGSEMLRRASALGLIAGDRQDELSRQAHSLVEEGRGDQLMLLPGWWYVTSARSFVELEKNVPVLLEAAAQIRCPVLYLRGDLEDPELYPAEHFAEVAAGPVDVRILPRCDHFYSGLEEEVGAMVCDWLAGALGA
ncbi:MAG: alpha/beta hydrolase [Acidimicrobiales bacterium]